MQSLAAFSTEDTTSTNMSLVTIISRSDISCPVDSSPFHAFP